MEKMQLTKGGIYFFLIIFIFAFFALFKLYFPFLMDLLIAFLLFIATNEIYKVLLKYVKYPLLSSFFMVLFLILLCFIPIFYVLLHLANIATSLDLGNFQNFLFDTQEHLIIAFKDILLFLPESLQKIAYSYLDGFHSLNWGEVIKKALGVLAKASKNSLYFFSDTIFIVIFLFFFYFYSLRLSEYFLRLIPLSSEVTKNIYNEVSSVISVVFYSSIFSMFLQGALFGLLVMFFGYNAVLFGVFYGFASLVPIVGGALVWIPLVCYEVYLGNYTNAIIIALYSIIIIATLIDNGVKPFIIALINRILLKTPVIINEILIFFAILAGLSSFGFWGIVLGPAITALFIALLRVYQSSILTKI